MGIDRLGGGIDNTVSLWHLDAVTYEEVQPNTHYQSTHRAGLGHHPGPWRLRPRAPAVEGGGAADRSRLTQRAGAAHALATTAGREATPRLDQGGLHMKNIAIRGA